jgi:hypothetical protein
VSVFVLLSYYGKYFCTDKGSLGFLGWFEVGLLSRERQPRLAFPPPCL